MASIESYETSRGRRYRVRYRTPDRDQTDKRGFRTKREAEEYLATVEVSKMRGEWIDATRGRITVAEWAEQWFAAQLQLKATTAAGYRLSIDNHIVPAWGRRRLVDIGHAEVQAWVTKLSTDHAASTVRQIYLVLSMMMKFAIRDGRVSRNPCEAVQLPRIVRKRRSYLTHVQVHRLAAECGEYGDVVLFLAYTGLRWGEMAGLKIERVDFERRRVEISEAVTTAAGRVVWSTPKSRNSRSVPFPEFLVDTIARRCQGRPGNELVFEGSGGGLLRSGNFRRRQFEVGIAACQETDPSFPRITIHDLRHTAASLAVSAGANVKLVQRMLGHASAAMTLDVYADLFDDDLDAVATALNTFATLEGVGKMWANHELTGSKRKVRGLKKSTGPGNSRVAPTGVDPVTSRFSVVRSTN